MFRTHFARLDCILPRQSCDLGALLAILGHGDDTAVVQAKGERFAQITVARHDERSVLVGMYFMVCILWLYVFVQGGGRVVSLGNYDGRDAVGRWL